MEQIVLPQQVKNDASKYADSAISNVTSDSHGLYVMLCNAYIAGAVKYGTFDKQDITDSSFEDFWNLYDKKRGRTESEKLWNKLGNADRKKAMAYIPLYKKAQPDKQYRQDPQRFLRRKTWNDELITSTTNGQDRRNLGADEQESAFLSSELERIKSQYLGTDA